MYFLLCMDLSDHTVYIFSFSTKVLRHSLNMTLSSYCILCIFLTRLWYVINPVYKTQRDVQILPVSFIYDHMVILLNFYGFKVYFTTFFCIFVQSLIYLSYSKDWGGGAMW